MYACVTHVMYTLFVRRLQIYMDEELDEALNAEAARSGRSKADLVRECVAQRYAAVSSSSAGDPLDALVGAFDVEPADVDDVVYGPR